MDSWGVSACYPRSTFYPLSDGPSTRNHRTTLTCFRTCSTCLSRSQAPLCQCSQGLVSNQAEGTFVRLRYLLGGDRPSQTPRLTMSLTPFQGERLDSKINKGGISRATPPKLAFRLQSLPPILHISTLKSLPS